MQEGDDNGEQFSFYQHEQQQKIPIEEALSFT
jgi:hypothetical protein